MFAFGLASLSGSVVARQATTLKGMLLSPGPLSHAHEKLSDKCSACHAEFSRESQTDLCLDCHKTVHQDIKGKQRFHGHLGNVTCTDCHTEHLGDKADISGMDMDSFDHDMTAFALHGRHKTLECIQCHSRARRSRNKLPGVWRLTRHACSSCHQDPHQGQLKGKCSACHTEVSWQRTRFDHSKTRFALTGGHRDVQCAACHKDATFSAPVSCNACHGAQDIHRGTMGTDCGKCHTSNRWRDTRFDHDKTRFPLGKQHAHVQCALCHTAPAGQFDAMFNKGHGIRGDCSACHRQDDVHRSSFGEHCGKCHTGARWRDVRFDHNRATSFALEGRHAKVACAGCHRPGKAVDRVHPRSACADCHLGDDIHRGSLGKQCGDCHTVSAPWRTTTFDHDFTDFPITGMHSLLSCNACHATAAFHTTRTRCDQCHQVGKIHAHVFLDHCQQCHNTLDWHTWQFDHGRTDFPLVGAHKSVGCFECHKDARTPSASAPDFCNACHARDDVHNGQFGQACQTCHNQQSFKDVKGARLR